MVDVWNQQGVGVHGDALVILNPPTRLTKQEALNFAAWLVELADTLEGDAIPFEVVRKVVSES